MILASDFFPHIIMVSSLVCVNSLSNSKLIILIWFVFVLSYLTPTPSINTKRKVTHRRIQTQTLSHTHTHTLTHVCMRTHKHTQ